MADDPTDMPEGPSMSELGHEDEFRHRPPSKGESDASVNLPNPLLGASEGETRRKRLNDEYSQYIWTGLKNDEIKKRSKSRSKHHRDWDKESLQRGTAAHGHHHADFDNVYAHKQRYQHSYFQYNVHDGPAPRTVTKRSTKFGSSALRTPPRTTHEKSLTRSIVDLHD